MLYLKCVIAGIAALVIASVVLPVMGILLLTLIVRPPTGTQIGFDPVSIAKSSPTVWLIALIVFASGFYWEFHRLMK
jgi:hypothetical protein